MTLPTTGNTTDPLAQGLDVQIGTNYFRLVQASDTALQVRTAPKRPVANPPDTSLNPEDFDRDEGERVFSMVDFTGGEGLEQFHRRDKVDAERRFWASEDVELYDRRGEPAVLRANWQVESLGQQTADGGATYTNGLVYAYDKLWSPSGTNVMEVTSPNGGAPVLSTEDPDSGGATNCEDLTTVAGTLYAAMGTRGIFTRTAGGSWSQHNTLSCTRIFGLKGRLVCFNDSGGLFEVTDATVPAATISLGADAIFTTACDAGAAILCGTDSGLIYALADNSGSLVNRGQTPFAGEVIVGLAFTQGRIGIVTVDQGANPDVARFYVAALKGDYTLGDTQLIREFDASTGDSPDNIRVAASRDSFLVAVVDESSDEVRVYRHRLDTGGLFRIHTENPAGANSILGLAEVEGQVFWTVQAGTALRLSRTHDTNRKSGAYLITALADHFDPKEKQFIGARLYCHQVPTNTTVTLELSTNPAAINNPAHGSWTTVVTRTSVDDSEEKITGLNGRWVAAKITFTSTDPTVSAEVKGFSVRSYQTERDVELVLPIDCSDTLTRPFRKPVFKRNRGDEIYDHLQTLEGGAVDITLLATSEQWRGNILEVSTVRPVVNGRGVEQLASVVRFRGRRL